MARLRAVDTARDALIGEEEADIQMGEAKTDTSSTRKRASSRSEGDQDDRTKRPKTTNENHERFWFHDGNVVVRVEGRLFRLHSSILAAKSKRMAEILSAENQRNAGELVDDCEVFDFEGRACHFTALLDALYGELLCLEGKVPSLLTLACLMRASHQWDVPAYAAWALKEIALRWPWTTLNQIQQRSTSTLCAWGHFSFEEMV
ncbi:hypothetical protein BOTBODRAFT_68748 [Botryobasidium botryosum FD-172 SS1]|uniref:BTB domain-containing protein n=1 Tax=Botryobasidium botryosum (strain FD-172 SS1) TaxID=930990 RepID=A0A067MEW9_BOTB1|nr:hypothetical protein BOTBODRAFT_68748 [Botryobasidium botryosum FD-172 SS1]